MSAGSNPSADDHLTANTRLIINTKINLILRVQTKNIQLLLGLYF